MSFFLTINEEVFPLKYLQVKISLSKILLSLKHGYANTSGLESHKYANFPIHFRLYRTIKHNDFSVCSNKAACMSKLLKIETNCLSEYTLCFPKLL